MKNITKIISLFAGVALVNNANALVKIDIESGNVDPLPLALTNLIGETGKDNQLGKSITRVIEDNLKSSGLFNITDKNAFLQSEESLKLSGPNFLQWVPIKVEGLFTGTSIITEDKATIEYRLFDVYDQKQVIGKKYTASLKFWRHIANRISDDIYTSMTGEKGYFTSRIAYIGENNVEIDGKNKTLKQLCVMNQDTSSQQCLTDGSSIVLTPRFSPIKQEIVYLSYANGRPRLYLLDLTTGKQTIVGDYKGLNSSPRFSPDGKSLLMTLTQGHEGNSEIYNLRIRDKKLRRLTFAGAIDTSPSFSPDGERIVFNSTRHGKPNLYIMDDDGNNLVRLTRGEGKYYAPVWSPRGDMIAFVKLLKGKFHIGIIDVDGDEERLLTEGFLDESPSWSPNGRVIIFARQTGDDTKLYAVDLTGYNLREVKTNTNASDPTWSPLLK